MKKFGYVLLLTFSSLISNINAFANEDVLLSITNNDNQKIITLIANSDNETDNLKSIYRDDQAPGEKTVRVELPPDQIEKGGVVLDQRGERIVVNLKSDNFDLATGGVVVIDTLYNGVTGERKSYELELIHETDGWKIKNDNAVISKLKIEVNKKMFIGTVGVKNIIME